MQDIHNEILSILEELCQTDIVKENPDIHLFDEGLLDSFGTVELLLEIENRLGILVAISDFDRDEWGTPNLIIAKLEGLK